MKSSLVPPATIHPIPSTNSWNHLHLWNLLLRSSLCLHTHQFSTLESSLLIQNSLFSWRHWTASHRLQFPMISFSQSVFIHYFYSLQVVGNWIFLPSLYYVIINFHLKKLIDFLHIIIPFQSVVYNMWYNLFRFYYNHKIIMIWGGIMIV